MWQLSCIPVVYRETRGRALDSVGTLTSPLIILSVTIRFANADWNVISFSSSFTILLNPRWDNQLVRGNSPLYNICTIYKLLINYRFLIWKKLWCRNDFSTLRKTFSKIHENYWYYNCKLVVNFVRSTKFELMLLVHLTL